MSHVRRTYKFATIPAWVLYHPSLTPTAVRVYACLDRHGQDPEDCYPSHARIARFLGMAESSIKRPLADLEAVGAIRIRARYIPDEADLDERGRPKVSYIAVGRQTSNGYELAGDAPLDAAHESATPPAQKSTSPYAEESTPRGSQKSPEREQEEREPVEREKTGVALRSAAVPPDTAMPDPPREEVLRVTEEDRAKARAALQSAKGWAPPDDHVALKVVSDD